MKAFLKISSFVILLLAWGCAPASKSSRGFRLPDGDVKRGEQAFRDLKCHRCHQVAGVETPAPEGFHLTLGGETRRVKTYGELVTSIINPSHVMSPFYQKELAAAKESPMPRFTREMSVEQMIDLVAFLQSHYRLVESPIDWGYP